jgi:hypothetical protein
LPILRADFYLSIISYANHYNMRVVEFTTPIHYTQNARCLIGGASDNPTICAEIVNHTLGSPLPNGYNNGYNSSNYYSTNANN